MKISGKTGFLAVALALSLTAQAQVSLYPLFGPSSGIMKGDPATPVTSSAAAADVYGLFGCTLSTQFLNGAGGCTTPSGTGVTSVGLTVPSWETVSGSPVTSSGTLAVTAATGQTANRFLATPDGTTGAVSLRAMVAGDVPPINLGSTANGGVTGTLPVTNGGNGIATATLGDLRYGSGTNTLAALAGNTTSTNKFLTQTGTGTVSAAPAWGTIIAGDVPPINLGSTANGGVSSATILLGTNGGTSNGFFSVTGPTTALRTFTFPNASATVLTTNAAVTVPQGGTGVATLTNHGVLLGQGASNVSTVAAMAADTLLQGQGTGADPAAVSVNNCGSSTTALSYSTSTHTFGCQTISAGSGSVTSVSAGTGITASPSPITTTGSISVNTATGFSWTNNHTWGSLPGGIALTVNQNGAGAGLQVRGGAANPAVISMVDGNTGNTGWTLENGTVAAGTFSLRAGGTSAIDITSSRGVTINQPSSGNALQVNAPALVSAYAGIFTSGSGASGTQHGLAVNAGATSSDVAFLVQNQPGSTSFFQINGTGQMQVPQLGTTASAANCFIDNASANNFLRSTSSRRYKQDINPLSLAKASEVLKLQPITYRSKAPADDPTKLWFGLIAEDVAAVEPRLVAYDAQGRPDGVQYDRVGVLTLAVVQRQQHEIETLRVVVALMLIWLTFLTVGRLRAC